MDESPDAPVPARRRTGPVVALVTVAFLVGGGLGWLLAPSDTATDRVGYSTTAIGSSQSELPLGLEPTLDAYLGALVAHDWPGAHGLMCADLAEQVTAGALKLELADAQAKAGALEDFTITSQPSDATGTATVEYRLEFARGSLDITADLEQEGAAWRVCSFTNGDGTGAFA
jgi:hypothetical protein